MKKTFIILITLLITTSSVQAGFKFKSTFTRSKLGIRSGKVLWNTNQNNRLNFGSLVSLWSFNGPDIDIANATATDRVGGFDGSIVNQATTTNFVPGTIGQAIKFAGGTANNVVSIADATGLRPTTVSLSAWFNCSSFATSTIIAKPLSAAVWTTPFASWMIRIDGPTVLEFGATNSGTYAGVRVAVTALATSTWYQVGMTFGGNSKKGYLNGAQTNSTAQGSASITYGAFPILIGGDFAASPYGDLTGCIIDDVRLYNRVLSATEMQQIYLAGK